MYKRQLIEDAGGRAAMNEQLSPLGINVDILRDVYISEQKTYAVMDYLYGDSAGGIVGAEAITDAQREEFYQTNYVAVKHIWIRTTDKLVTDEDGAVVDVYKRQQPYRKGLQRKTYE